MTALRTPAAGRPRALRRIAVAATVALVAAVVPTHAAMTFLHVAPTNPVSVAANSAVTSWIYPYFQQNWQLFAPDPVSRDNGVLAQGRTSADGEATGYVDLSSPMLERKLHSLVPDRLPYVVSGASHSFLTARQNVLDAMPSDSPPLSAAGEEVALALPKEVLEEVSPMQVAAYDDALNRLAEVAALHVREDTGADPTQVQVRLVTHTFPRWSQRHDAGLGEISYSDLPWYDLDSKDLLS